MTKRNYDIIIGVVFMAIAVYVIATAYKYPAGDLSNGYGAGVYPILIAAILFLLALGIVIQALCSEKWKTQEVPGTRLKNLKYPAMLWGTMLVFCLLMKPVGFLLDGVAYMLFASKALFKASWRAAVLSSVAVPLLIWLVFKVLMGIPLPQGTIWSVLSGG